MKERAAGENTEENLGQTRASARNLFRIAECLTPRSRRVGWRLKEKPKTTLESADRLGWRL